MWTLAEAIAGIDSFTIYESSLGVGGTNAFVVLEEAPPMAASEPASSAPEPLVLALSARSEHSLRALSDALAERLAELGSAQPWQSLCAAASAERSEFPQRLALTGPSAIDQARIGNSHGNQRTEPGASR